MGTYALNTFPLISLLNILKRSPFFTWEIVKRYPFEDDIRTNSLLLGDKTSLYIRAGTPLDPFRNAFGRDNLYIPLKKEVPSNITYRDLSLFLYYDLGKRVIPLCMTWGILLTRREGIADINGLLTLKPNHPFYRLYKSSPGGKPFIFHLHKEIKINEQTKKKKEE